MDVMEAIYWRRSIRDYEERGLARPLMEELEPRVLLSADVDPDLIDPSQEHRADAEELVLDEPGPRTSAP